MLSNVENSPNISGGPTPAGVGEEVEPLSPDSASQAFKSFSDYVPRTYSSEQTPQGALDATSYPPSSNYLVPLSGDSLIDGLLLGYKWGSDKPGEGTTLTFSFKTPDTIGINPVVADYATNPWYLDDREKQAVREALATWARYANLKFVEVPETTTSQGDLRFGGTYNMADETPDDDTKPRAEAVLPKLGDAPESGDVWLSHWFRDPLTTQPSDELAPGGPDFLVLLHEVGHALGLKHPHEASKQNNLLLDENYDTQRETLMSYECRFSIYPASPQWADIRAIQYLYGANNDNNLGNTTYNLGYGQPIFDTIWDPSGSNTLDASGQTQGVNISLLGGDRSSVGGEISDTNDNPNNPVIGRDYLKLAEGTVMDNAVGSHFDDTLMGNGSDNILEGGAGNDWLYGRGGNDTAILNFTSDPDSVKLETDPYRADSWLLVNAEGRTLARLSSLTNGLMVEDVREDQDLLPGQTSRLGIDFLDGIENLYWGPVSLASTTSSSDVSNSDQTTTSTNTSSSDTSNSDQTTASTNT